MITLNTFLLAAGVSLDLSNYKVHLATTDDTSPLDAYLAGTFKEWQEDQGQGNFTRKQVVSLIHLENNLWLFAGVYEVIGRVTQPGSRQTIYETSLLPGQDELIGRVLVKHQRSFRNSYLIGQEDLAARFILAEYLPQKISVEEFPGYHAVDVSYEKLQLIIGQNLGSWRGALSNMKGVYLISDTLNGKLYVGSATGEKGIWQRWGEYAVTGHGGNKDLKTVLKDKGKKHAHNFRYSILEIADSYANDLYVLQREQYWKGVLLSKAPFGYNMN